MIYKKDLQYPSDFYSFSNGSKVTEEETNNWIQECLDEIDLDKDYDSYILASGDTKVQVIKNLDNIEITVANSDGYSEFECEIKDIIRK